MLKFCLLAVLVGVICVINASAEKSSETGTFERSYCSSIADMTQLLQLEANFIKNLENYAWLLQSKLDVIQKATSDLRAENKKSQEDTEAYLANPLTGFALIRRMHSDWNSWQSYMAEPVGQPQIDYVQQLRHAMPTSTDMSEAAKAIHRIQETYDFEPADIARGLLNGKQYDAKLSPLDCYALGLDFYEQEKYSQASHWFYVALQNYEDDVVYMIMNVNRTKLLDTYATTMLKLNRPTDALQIIEHALAFNPKDEALLLKREEIARTMKVPTGPPMQYSKPPVRDYERGCRGEFNKTSRLHCRYNATTTPFLRLAPLKMEEVQKDPYMVLYHEIIYPSEIAELQELARPRLGRASIFNTTSNRPVVKQTRTSKVAWLPDNYNPTVKRINERVRDMTGFDTSGSELLQVMNYGLGGHYEQHYDFFNVSSDTEIVRVHGDRMATVLFYLNDVDQGGATVFPHLKKAVLPQRGSAVFWYNLDNAGKGDYRTMHAACPVIAGSKWVTNKWIREKQQMFRRPCYKNKQQ